MPFSCRLPNTRDAVLKPGLIAFCVFVFHSALPTNGSTQLNMIPNGVDTALVVVGKVTSFLLAKTPPPWLMLLSWARIKRSPFKFPGSSFKTSQRYMRIVSDLGASSNLGVQKVKSEKTPERTSDHRLSFVISLRSKNFNPASVWKTYPSW
jgi:hypothetical protein